MTEYLWIGRCVLCGADYQAAEAAPTNPATQGVPCPSCIQQERGIKGIVRLSPHTLDGKEADNVEV